MADAAPRRTTRTRNPKGGPSTLAAPRGVALAPHVADSPPPASPPDEPYIPASTILPEITVKAVLLGIVLAILLGAANVYLGLKAGLTVAASIPAAVMSLAVLRLFRKHNILENNMVQTIASAGTSVASGAIFTIPALIILGYWDFLHYWETTFIIIVGGLLGVLFSVPIRRALIIEERLPFPEGRATGEVLKTGEKGGMGVGALVLGGGLGALFKVLQGGFRFWKEETGATVRLGEHSVLGMGFNLQPALLGVGVIIGLRIAVLVFLGGVLGWFVGIPLYTYFAGGAGGELFDVTRGGLRGGVPVSLWERAGMDHENLPAVVWSYRIRYIGVGAMLVGGVWSLVKLRKPLSRAIAQGIRSARGSTAESRAAVPRTERDLPFSVVGLGAIVLAVPMALFYFAVSGDFLVAMVMALIMLVTGFMFSAVGGYMAGLVGSSNTPISGVTILALLSACLALLAFGVTESLGPPLAVFVAAVIAVAGSISGDNLQDLKAGHMLGATPRKQQWMIMVGAVASAFVVVPVIQTLIDGEAALGNVSESAPLGSIAAPQANLMAALSAGVFSAEGLAVQAPMIWIGAGLAVALILLNAFLTRIGSSFRTPVMPVAVGIYLPVGLSVPIFLGGVMAWLVEAYYLGKVHAAAGKTAAWWKARASDGERAGILFASGLIAGEAVMGIATAFLRAQDPTNQLGLFSAHEGHDWAGFLFLGYMAFLAWYLGIRPGLQRLRGPPPS